MSDWRPVHVGTEGDDIRLGDVEIWRSDWRQTGGAPLQLPHPAHPRQLHRFEIFEAGPPGCPVRFAAGELSNGVWSFYVPG